ncbi:membrane protein, putative [hydrothermal vent metagenome]|uniref:Membrane protein, putative n=1 Tax=hydrothermal vent metagenome TaxID=652676 RepID=A0A3B0THG9_9ZZZZ
MALSRFNSILVAVLSILVALVSYRFLALGIDDAFPDFKDHIALRNLAFVAHVTASPIALFIGAFQFFPKMRAKRPTLHHWMGRIYGVSVLVGGVSGIALALGAVGGPIASAGFGLLAIAWIFTTAQAVRLAMAKNFQEHREWMIRSFALTFAAVTLRLLLVGFMVAGFEYGPATVYIAWLCWVPNLIFAQWWINRTKNKAVAA